MEKKITVKDIVLEFFRTTRRQYINEGYLERECARIAEKRNKYANASSYSRTFRKIREYVNPRDLRLQGWYYIPYAKLFEVTKDNRNRKFRYKTWEIVR